MATDEIAYLTYTEAVLFHIELMRQLGEARYGVFNRTLVESALARARQAAVYAQADLLGQAATLCYGFIKNHPWVGGNKRTATGLMELFLSKNGVTIDAATRDMVELVLAVEADQWQVDEVESWLRQHAKELI